MYLECTCTQITQSKWDRLMKGARRASQRKLNSLVKKHLPDLYEALALEFPNPYDYFQTRTHWILVHSAIEYFIRKD